MRICNKCKKQKPEAEFNKNPRVRDGLSNWCKECHKDYVRLWYLRNSDKVKAKTKNWRVGNKEKKRESNRLYNKRHPEKHRERDVKWRKRNSEKSKEYDKSWRVRNPESYKQGNINSQNKRRAIYEDTDITTDWLIQLKKNITVCPLCSCELNNTKYHPHQYNLDHIKLLSLGGTHTMDNVRYVCRRCNLKRRRKEVQSES